MPIKVRIPTPLQKHTNNQAEVSLEAGNIKELIENLEKSFPGVKSRICDDKGKIRKFINIYVNEEDIRFLKMDETPIKDGDEISIIPAIAGGTFKKNKLTPYQIFEEFRTITANPFSDHLLTAMRESFKIWYGVDTYGNTRVSTYLRRGR